MNYKTAKILVYILFLIGIVLCMLSGFVLKSSVPMMVSMLILGILAITTGIVLILVFFKCQKCKRNLFFENCKYECPHCHQKFNNA